MRDNANDRVDRIDVLLAASWSFAQATSGAAAEHANVERP